MNFFARIVGIKNMLFNVKLPLKAIFENSIVA